MKNADIRFALKPGAEFYDLPKEFLHVRVDLDQESLMAAMTAGTLPAAVQVLRRSAAV